MTPDDPRREPSLGPFGNPDGARAEISDLLDGWVNLSVGALSTAANDASARVLVGKLGAGKTVYLRRLQSYQASHAGVYADHEQQDVPSTELIVRFSQWYRPHQLTEKWGQLWHRAILRSLASHVLCNKILRPHVSEEQAEALASYRSLIGSPRRPHSIYSEVRAIINEHNTANHANRYLDNSGWDDLKVDLGDVVANCPPIFFYLDAVDEEFQSAPMYWLRCQEGLFIQAMRMIRDPRFGNRLHVVVSIRDMVMSKVLKSQHGPRYQHEPHIRILDWSRESLDTLLREKIHLLAAGQRMAPGVTSPIESWLGSAWIHNDALNVTEALEDYLIRHTRLIPRDVVTLGNALCEEIEAIKLQGMTEFPPDRLQRVVARTSKRFGDSQFAQTATQIAADLMPADAAARGYSDYYIGAEYARTLQDHVKELVRALGIDQFDEGVLNNFDELAELELGKGVRLSTALWQNGLLGYRDGLEFVFYSLTDVNEFDLPRHTRRFVLHPCVADSVPGIRLYGREPVRPYRVHA